MAVVNGPLFSLEASGTVGTALVYSRWKGRPYVRRHAIPSNPKSDGQVSVRAMLMWLSRWWNGMTAAEKTSWDERADNKNISPFNEYVGYNLFQHRNFASPTNEFPAAKASTPPALPVVTPTGGSRNIYLSIADGSPAPDMAYRIHRSTTSSFTPTWSNCIAVVDWDSGGTTAYTDTPLDPGTYYYQVFGLNDDGISGPPSTEVSATAT